MPNGPEHDTLVRAVLITAVPYIDMTLGANMQLPDEVACAFFQHNAECRRNECPYFPGADAEVKASFQPGSAQRRAG